jgi:hypothetical protein
MLCSLIYYYSMIVLVLSAHLSGLRLRLSLRARGLFFPTNLPLTLLLVARAGYGSH